MYGDGDSRLKRGEIFYFHVQFWLISVDLVFLNECSEHDKTLVCL